MRLKKAALPNPISLKQVVKKLIYFIFLLLSIHVEAQYTPWVLHVKEGASQQKIQVKKSVDLKAIAKYAQKGYLVTDLSFADERWYIVFSKNDSLVAQKVNSSTSFPEDWLNLQYKDGFRLSGAAFNGTIWLVTVLKTTHPREEYWIKGDALDCNEFISQHLTKDTLFQTRFTAYGGGEWIITMEKNNSESGVSQKHKLTDYDKLDAWFAYLKSTNQYLQHIAYGKDKWYITSNTNSGNKIKEELRRYETYPKKEIKRIVKLSQESGWNIISMQRAWDTNDDFLAQEYYEKSFASLITGDYDMALEYIDLAIKKKGNKGYFHGQKASILFYKDLVQDDPEILLAALSSINEALKYEHSSNFYELKAKIENNLYAFNEALQSIDIAINSDQKSQYFQLRGMIYQNLKQYDLAIEDFTRLKAYDPTWTTPVDSIINSIKDLHYQKKEHTLYWDAPNQERTDWYLPNYAVKACIGDLSGSAEIQLKVNGNVRFIETDLDIHNYDCSHYIEENIELNPGVNTIEIFVSLNGNNYKFPKKEILYHEDPKENIHMLLVDFDGDSLGNYFVNNLKRYFQDVYGSKQAYTQVLSRPTKSIFLKQLQEMVQTVEESDKLILYFHGRALIKDKAETWITYRGEEIPNSEILRLYAKAKTTDRSIIKDPNYYKEDQTHCNVVKDTLLLPAEYSLEQYCPSVRNQGSHGTCGAWASAYAAKTILAARVNGWTDQQVIDSNAFAPGFVFRNAKWLGDMCYGGSGNLMIECLKEYGCPKFNDYPEPCPPETIPDSIYEKAALHKIDDYEQLWMLNYTPEDRVEAVKKALYRGNPIMIAIKISPLMQTHKQDYYINEFDENSPDLLYHGMCVVGYNDSKYGGSFRLMNSWGESWGDNGFTWIKYADFARYVYEATEIIDNQSVHVQNEISGSIKFENMKGENYHVTPLHGSYFRFNEPARVGDRYRIVFNNNQDNYIYILTENADGKAIVAHPRSHASNKPINSAVNQLYYPNKNYYFRLNEVHEDKPVVLIHSKNRLEVNELRRKLYASSAHDLYHKITEALEVSPITAQNTLLMGGDKLYYSCNKPEKDLLVIPVKAIVLD